MRRNGETRSGCLWGIVFLLGLAFLFTLAGVLAVTTWRGGESFAFGREADKGVDEYPELDEVWSCGEGDAKVISIPVQGLIMLGEQGGGMFGSEPGAADAALLSIRRATGDPEVRAIILRVDSGGGGITASDVLYKALLDFKARQPGRKIVALFGDVAASGAYYVSLAADCIIAHPTSMTGSIGVLIQTFNARELAERVGVKDVTIKSGTNKDLLNPLGEMTEEQRAMLQAMVDELHGRFVSLVAKGRRMPEESVRKLADGRIMTASRALEAGLVDQLGYWEDAMERTARLLGEENVKVYRYEVHFSFSSLLRASQRWDPVRGLLDRMSQTRLMYLWRL